MMFWLRLFSRKLLDWRDATVATVRSWFRTKSPPPVVAIDPVANILAAGLVPLPVVPLAPSRFINRPGKFVKPKGEAPVKLKRERTTEPKPRKPRVKLPDQRPVEDPDQWGQYYFRDAVLDQLGMYFMYLKRMKKGDRDSYNLHRQIGIQLMPHSALQSFDTWRNEGQIDELSAWFKEHRPSFGAVAYSIEKDYREETLSFVDAPPEFFTKERRYNKLELEKFRKHSITTITQGGRDVDIGGGIKQRDGLIWIPKFLYFFKYNKVPKQIEVVSNADIYMMTVYWDRVKGHSKGFHKRHPGGSPQEYALSVDRTTNAVRILRREVHETLRIKSRRSAKGFISIPRKYWIGAADRHLRWAFGRSEASPEQYLIRCFIEAALMFEHSAMGSMVRIEAKKGDLVATFGVDIKRMSYFFKDRDITLTPKGKRARIFHIVRPHMRQTKKGEAAVKLSFRGLRQFTWADYKISITVPGLDHLNIAEADFAGERMEKGERYSKDKISTKALGEILTDAIKTGRGKWRANAI